MIVELVFKYLGIVLESTVDNTSGSFKDLWDGDPNRYCTQHAYNDFYTSSMDHVFVSHTDSLSS
jgi:hypothetical protein